MSDLRELYQETILDHGRRPRNFRPMAGASHHAEGFNPLCGDKLELFLELDGDRVVDASFQGSGCAISTASASMLTEYLRGKSKEEALEIFRAFHHMVVGGGDAPPDMEKLGKLAVFGGVSEFPNRVKCATLAWHTLEAALEKAGDEPVSTE